MFGCNYAVQEVIPTVDKDRSRSQLSRYRVVKKCLREVLAQRDTLDAGAELFATGEGEGDELSSSTCSRQLPGGSERNRNLLNYRQIC